MDQKLTSSVVSAVRAIGRPLLLHAVQDRIWLDNFYRIGVNPSPDFELSSLANTALKTNRKSRDRQL
jgi:hypothetical protein